MLYQNKAWGDVFPAGDPEATRSEAEHLLNIGGKSLGAVEPTDSSGLHKHDEEDGVACSVIVQQLHHVHPALIVCLIIIK